MGLVFLSNFKSREKKCCFYSINITIAGPVYCNYFCSALCTTETTALHGVACLFLCNCNILYAVNMNLVFSGSTIKQAVTCCLINAQTIKQQKLHGGWFCTCMCVCRLGDSDALVNANFSLQFLLTPSFSEISSGSWRLSILLNVFFRLRKLAYNLKEWNRIKASVWNMMGKLWNLLFSGSVFKRSRRVY